MKKLLPVLLVPFFISCSKEIPMVTTPPFTLSLGTSSVSADGVSQVPINISITNEVDSVFKMIKIQADGGLFEKIGANEPDTTVFIDTPIGDVFTINLRVGITPGDYFIKASLVENASFQRQETYTLTKVDPTSIINSGSFPTSLISNDELINYTIQVTGYKADQVKLQSNVGSFGVTNLRDTTLILSETGNASFRYRSGMTPGRAQLTIEAMPNSLKTVHYFELTDSKPDDLSVFPSKYEIDSGASVSFEVFLEKALGKVSAENEVLFSAFQNDGSGNMMAVGRFTGIPAFSNSEEKVTGVTFHLDTRFGNKTEPIIIEVSTESQSGATVAETLSIDVND